MTTIRHDLDLASLRRFAGLSQFGLAQFSGLHLSVIRALESGDAASFPRLSASDIDRLADALGLSDAARDTILRPALARGSRGGAGGGQGLRAATRRVRVTRRRR